MLKHTIILAFLYWLFGKIALFLAIPPGYSTAIWPAAGIALAFVLRYGYGVWPGILIGSFFVNVQTGFDMSSTAATMISVILAFSIGAGAALQAVFTAYLFKKQSDSMELIELSQIGSFILSGIIGCLVSPTVGTTALIISGRIKLDTLLSGWGTWWVGDIIGVVLFVPLTLVWIAGSHNIWRSRRYFLTIPLALMFGIIICVFHFGYNTETKKLEGIFKNEAEGFVNAMQYKLREFDVLLDGLQGFYDGSDFVGRHEFKVFLSHALNNLPEIKSVAWVPVVTDETKEKFIQAARAEGFPDYYIKEVGPDGKFMPVQEHEVYYPLFYLEPLEGNEMALGINNGSETNRRETTEAARDSAQAKATAPITLAQDKASGLKSILMIAPVYEKTTFNLDTVTGRRKGIKGFITATMRVVDIINGASRISQSLTHINLTIYDVTSEEEVVYVSPKAELAGDGMSEEILIDVAGRNWKFVFKPYLSFYAGLQTWTLWMIIVGALLISSFLNILLLFITGQTESISKLVDQRTKELQERTQELENTKSSLEGKVKERTQTLEAVKVGLEEQVQVRTKELKERMEELEQTNQALIGRESKMIELKETIKKLQERIDAKSNGS